MKIAIPTDDKITVANHFGRCLIYLCFNENMEETGEIQNTSEHMGGKGLPLELLKNNNVDILLCRDLGPSAIQLCEKNGIKVYKYSEAESISNLLELWKTGKLSKATLTDGCENHH